MLLILLDRPGRPGTLGNMVRTLQLDEWVGEWVAVDRSGHVLAHAAQLRALIAEVEDRALFETEIMRAPDPSAPVSYGFG